MCVGRVPERVPMRQAEAGVRFARIRLATGPELHYAEQGDSAGEAILFLHGWPDSWFSFSRVLPLLPHRYRAFALDQRGFGDSERPASGYGIDDLASDAVAFLDAVSVQQATVVGHSLGSFIARRVQRSSRSASRGWRSLALPSRQSTM